MRKELRGLGENTRAAHPPTPPVPQQAPLGLPVWRAGAYAFAGAAEHAALAAGEAPGYTSGLAGNPSADAFAEALAALEGVRLSEPVEAQAFASGMAAATAVLLAFTGAGAHVVAPAACDGGLHGLLTGLLARFGVRASFVDGADPAAVRAAIRPSTRLVWAETLSAPAMAVADLPLLAEIAHEAGALLVADSTLATPVVCRPLEHGADLVVHAAGTCLGGHGDATGGAVAGAPALLAELRRVRTDTGAVLAPDEAFLLRRGLETLPLRIRRQCDTANLFAAALARHPDVKAVGYPGLPGHPGHALARELFDAGPEGTRFGAAVTVTPHGGADAGLALADALRLPLVAATFGGARTTAHHVASTTHRHRGPDALAAAGVDPGAVRFSLGLEDADDLIRDVTEALAALRRARGAATREPLVADTG
ncbi:trans-sulfuration enzyme family protein [Actinomadura parmotrematis]|uniref:PLP-dependent transferase n=1 Tax=Actinomadura parmotrematis TaxID=2864039 RepID=A0ABS7G2I2_9ACTN|nr:PLP-dependent transferase [Actinomadura parmotrematis]MBW8486084.1 PLP-dependent transferase [Actinomadura parmotrematis]